MASAKAKEMIAQLEERVELPPCLECGQVNKGQTGEYPCKACGLPKLHDAVDKVNHPAHYNQGKIECIEFIEDQRLGFHLGNAVKYITRAGKKDPAKTTEDLEKAIWYVRRHLETLKPEAARRRPNAMPQERA